MVALSSEQSTGGIIEMEWHIKTCIRNYYDVFDVEAPTQGQAVQLAAMEAYEGAPDPKLLDHDVLILDVMKDGLEVAHGTVEHPVSVVRGGPPDSLYRSRGMVPRGERS